MNAQRTFRKAFVLSTLAMLLLALEAAPALAGQKQAGPGNIKSPQEQAGAAYIKVPPPKLPAVQHPGGVNIPAVQKGPAMKPPPPKPPKGLVAKPPPPGPGEAAGIQHPTYFKVEPPPAPSGEAQWPTKVPGAVGAMKPPMPGGSVKVTPSPEPLNMPKGSGPGEAAGITTPED